jgi:NADH-quinone oxidoreductase subunit E
MKKPASSKKPRGNGSTAGPPKKRSPNKAAEVKMDPAVARWFAHASVQFARARASTIPMLQSAQAALGYLPRDAMQAIARHLGVAPAVVEGVASFYAQFRFNKPGKHRVTVCSGTACYVRGSGKLMEDIQTDLKVVPGGTTADGAISLESVSCFGACALAPVVVLDDKVLRQQTSNSIKKVLHELAAVPSKGRTRAARPASAPRGARK